MADLKVLTEADVKILQELISNAKRGRLNSLPAPQPDLDDMPSPETYIAYGSVPGLTAGVGSAPATPGTSTCAVYQLINEELHAVEGLQFTVYNLAEEAISGYFSIHRSKMGQWLAIAGTCCVALCCNLKVGVSDTITACQCSVNVPLYKPAPDSYYLTGSILPLATRDYVLAEDGDGFDGESINSVDYILATESAIPSGYQAFGANHWPEPVSMLRWELDFNLNSSKDLIVVPVDPLDTVVVTEGITKTITYRGVQIDEEDNVGEFFDNYAFLDRNPQNAYTSPVKQFLYDARTSDTRITLYEDPSNPSPNQAFYDEFSIFELEVNIDEELELSLAVPPRDHPVNWVDYPEITSTEDLYKDFNGGGWLGFLQAECQRLPYSSTGTASGSVETVAVLGANPDGSRSKAWTTVVVGGQPYTCKWIAGYDGEELEDVLAETPIAQSQLFMRRYLEGITTDQLYRQPFLESSPQYQGATPRTIPQSRWHPVAAWAGTKDEVGTGSVTGTGSELEVWVLPNGIDWRKTCLRISNFDDWPFISLFEDGWFPIHECLNLTPIPGGCSEYVSGTP